MLIYSLRQTIKILIAALGLLMLPSIFAVFVDEASLGEMPIYYLGKDDSKTHAMLFDPVSRMSTPILRSSHYTRLQLSANGLLAFSHYPRWIGDLFVMDVQQPLSPVLNITENLEEMFAEPLSWSPDGRYLVIESIESSEEHLTRFTYIWDGEQLIDITPSDPQPSSSTYHLTQPAWSHDGRLAFTLSGHSREIYVWDGQTTVNLSRDLSRDDHSPIWDHTGRLAFVSVANFEELKIMVWDGVSSEDGLPNKATFVEVAPELTTRHSIPVWMPDGRLAFWSDRNPNNTGQTYVWDGPTTNNLSQHPDLDDGIPFWSADGQRAYREYSSGARLIHVRDVNNRTLLKTEAEYSPTWSAKGQLLFCQLGESGWSLQMWDGNEMFELTTGEVITAQWPGGTWVTCHS